MTEPAYKPEPSEDYHPVVFRIRVLALLGTAVIAVIATTVFVVGRLSFYRELELTIVLVAIALFSFLSYSLYRGASIVGKPILPEFKVVEPSVIEGLPTDFIDIGGTIGSIVAWLVLTVLFAFLFAVVMTAVWSLLLLLVFALYWLFYRALRVVLLNAGKCRGDLWLSFRYSLSYTVLYTGWIYVITRLRELYVAKEL